MVTPPRGTGNSWNKGSFRNAAGNSSEGSPQTSKFNSASLKIFRLHSSWERCRVHWRNGNITSLNEELDLLWFELEADARTEQVGVVAAIDKEYSESLVLKNGTARHKAFSALRKKWLLLLRIEKDQGLGKAYYDPSVNELD